MRLGYLCFGCSNPCNALVNKHWCEECLSKNYYSGEKITMSQTGDKDYDEMLEMCFSVMKTKGVDYAGVEDRLSEIRHTAADVGTSMRQILGAYMNKHLRSIFKWIRGKELLGEPIEEKIKDMIVYLLMTYKLVKEERADTRQPGVGAGGLAVEEEKSKKILKG